MDNNAPSNGLGYRAASQALEVPESWVRSWVADDAIPYHRMAKNSARFSRSALLSWKKTVAFNDKVSEEVAKATSKRSNGVRQPKRRARTESQLTNRMRQRGYLRSTEVAALVGVHRATLYRWIQDGLVEYVDFSGAYYVQWTSVVTHMGAAAKVLGLPATVDKIGR